MQCVASLSQLCACAALLAHQHRADAARLPPTTDFLLLFNQDNAIFLLILGGSIKQEPCISVLFCVALHPWVINLPVRNTAGEALTLQAKTYSSFFRLPISRKLFERAAAKSSPNLLLRKLKRKEKGKR